MADANPDRGEHELVLADKTYRLRPSFAAVRAIERKTEKSLLALTLAGNVGDMTFDQASIIATELIRAGADEGDELTRAVSADRIAELIYEEGVPSVMARLTICLADAASGGRKASGEAKAVAGTTAAATGE